jgi:hypothetical protein
MCRGEIELVWSELGEKARERCPTLRLSKEWILSLDGCPVEDSCLRRTASNSAYVDVDDGNAVLGGLGEDKLGTGERDAFAEDPRNALLGESK